MFAGLSSNSTNQAKEFKYSCNYILSYKINGATIFYPWYKNVLSPSIIKIGLPGVIRRYYLFSNSLLILFKN